MQLLVSPKNISEAQECAKANVDIIDIKNPLEGSLGANFPWIIKEIRQLVPTNIPLSATLGDVPFKPGSVALAALGAATAGASFVKVGLFGTKNDKEAVAVMQAVSKTIKEFNLPVKVVAAGYAEGEAIGSVSPLEIPTIAAEAHCDYAMLDTYDKTIGKTLFDHLTIPELNAFIKKANELNLKTAFGGSISKDHLKLLQKLQPDIIGIRGAVCEQEDRLNGSIQASLIRDFIKEMKSRE